MSADNCIHGEIQIGYNNTTKSSITIMKDCIVCNCEIIDFVDGGYMVAYDDSSVFKNLCDAIAYCLNKKVK